MKLTGKVVLITGAATPVGASLAAAFAATEASLAVIARRTGECCALQEQLGSRVHPFCALPCDLCDEQDIVRMVHRVSERFGRVDVLVNAGTITGPRFTVMDYPVDPWVNVLTTNLTGTYLVCREVVPWMTRQGGGSIINVTSSLATGSRSVWGAYVVSNHGIEGLTQLMAAELRGSGVRVNSVELTPGHVEGRQIDGPHDWTMPFIWLASDASASHSGRRFPAGEALITH